MSTTQEQFDAVVEFMTVAGQDVHGKFGFVEPTTKVGNFRLALIHEEMNGANELFDSIAKDNLNGILDGVCDVLYVAYGALATFGLKADSYTIPAQRATSKSTALPMSHANELMKRVKDGYEQTVRGLLAGDIRTISNGLNNIIFCTIDIATAHNFDLDGAFKEVHASNMAKFCKSYNDGIDDIAARQREGKQDYDGATVAEVVVGDVSYFVIRRRGDGKVLKGLSFFEPELDKFIK